MKGYRVFSESSLENHWDTIEKNRDERLEAIHLLRFFPRNLGGILNLETHFSRFSKKIGRERLSLFSLPCLLLTCLY